MLKPAAAFFILLMRFMQKIYYVDNDKRIMIVHKCLFFNVLKKGVPNAICVSVYPKIIKHRVVCDVQVIKTKNYSLLLAHFDLRTVI